MQLPGAEPGLRYVGRSSTSCSETAYVPGRNLDWGTVRIEAPAIWQL